MTEPTWSGIGPRRIAEEIPNQFAECAEWRLHSALRITKNYRRT